MSDNESVQDRARRLVRQEVYLCVSSLVHTLASGVHSISQNTDMGRCLGSLAEQAIELSGPLPDYEEAARYEGWKVSDSGTQFVNEKDVDPDTGQCAAYGDFEGGNPLAADWCGLCENYGIEPYDREVFEHWAVSDWLADKLESRGEKVDRDFANLTVWARTNTGQAIYCYGVIEDIARELIEKTED